MYNFRVDVTYKRDDDGLITRAGAAWEEERPQTESFLLSCVVASIFTLLAGLLVPPLLVFGLIGLVTSGWLLVSIRGPQRALYFDDEGQIDVPFGTADYAGARVRWHSDEVVSIEARMQHPQPKTEGMSRMFEVILVSADGELVKLSRNLHEETALKIAAQLTKALGQLRKEHSATIQFGGAWGSVT